MRTIAIWSLWLLAAMGALRASLALVLDGLKALREHRRARAEQRRAEMAVIDGTVTVTGSSRETEERIRDEVQARLLEAQRRRRRPNVPPIAD